MSSLRRRLVLTLLGGLLLGGVLGGAGLYWQSIDELDELFDERLRTLANSLTAEALIARAPGLMEAEEEDDIVIQLWTQQGERLFSSISEDHAPAPTQAGKEVLNDSSDAWHSYARRLPNGGWLQVAQAHADRQEMAAKSAAHLLLPLLLLFPLLALFTALTVSHQLRPLRSLAGLLRRQGTLRSSPIALGDAPRELQPMIDALNELLVRQSEAAKRQQAFLADTAHELRTPLTVVNLQLQRLQQAQTPGERAEALAALKAGVERSTRLVTQLLSLARSETEVMSEALLLPLEFEVLVKNQLAEMFPLAAHKAIDLGLVESQACPLLGDEDALKSLVGNLIDNAIRYTPASGRIDITLRRNEAWARLTIADNGPGIPAEQRKLVFERFTRLGYSDAVGTGLGLAIARQIVERHRGSIALTDKHPGPGLSVLVSLPLAGSTAP